MPAKKINCVNPTKISRSSASSNKQFNKRIVTLKDSVSQLNAPRLTNLRQLFLGQKSNDSSPSKYKQIVDIFRYSGGHTEAEIHLIYWGVSPVYRGLLLAYAEYDAVTSGGVS